MPIKSETVMFHIEKRAIVRTLVNTKKVYEEGEAIELILSKLEMAKGSEVYEYYEPLICMIEEIIYKGLNVTYVDFSDNLTTFYVYFEDYSDFDVVASKMKHNKCIKNTCSAEYFLTHKIWFPYHIEIEDDENLMSILGKILNLSLGQKTEKFYRAMIPYLMENIDLVNAEIKNGYLILTIKGKDHLSLEDYEEEVLKRYEVVKDGGLID